MRDFEFHSSDPQPSLLQTMINQSEKDIELTTLREKVKRLEAGGVTTSDFLTPIERQRDQLEIENHRLKSRIRELEEAFPEPNVLRAISNAFTPQYPQDGLKAIVCRMADRIEKVMTKQPSEK